MSDSRETDGSTTLNPGVGGDDIDETIVTRADGTTVKRNRMVIGDDEGNVLGRNGYDEIPVSASAPGLEARLDTIIELLTRQNELIAAMSGQLL